MKRYIKSSDDVKTYRVYEDSEYNDYGGVAYLLIPIGGMYMATFEVPSDYTDGDLATTIADCCKYAEDHDIYLQCYDSSEYDMLDEDDKLELEEYGTEVWTDDGTVYYFQEDAFANIRVQDYI